MTTARDRRLADDVVLEQALRCRAQGCPHPWAVTFGGKLCSAHALCKSPREWPIVTARLLAEETDRALQVALEPDRFDPAPAMDRAKGVAALRQIREGVLFERGDPKGWARRLSNSEARGRSLSPFQRAAWREALGAHAVLDQVARGANVPEQTITSALQHTGDLPTADNSPEFDESDQVEF
jgi:hypothetical protein